MTTPELLGLAALSAVLLAGALGTVLSRNLVHSVLWLALTLVATAGLYLKLLAGFLAGAQVLLYAGGVVTLAIFGVMLTTRQDGGPIRHESAGRARGALTALVVAACLCTAILAAPLPDVSAAPAPDAAAVGRSFLTDFVLPFEVLSVLLVAAMVGAIVLARKEDA